MFQCNPCSKIIQENLNLETKWFIFIVVNNKHQTHILARKCFSTILNKFTILNQKLKRLIYHVHSTIHGNQKLKRLNYKFIEIVTFTTKWVGISNKTKNHITKMNVSGKSIQYEYYFFKCCLKHLGPPVCTIASSLAALLNLPVVDIFFHCCVIQMSTKSSHILTPITLGP